VIEKRHYVGLFLLSVAMLILELSLTRVLSVALWYHFSFLVISTALLGFGAAGVTLAIRRDLRESASLDRALALLSLAFGVATVGSFWLMQRIPFDPFSLFADRRQLAFMPAYYLAIAAPFYCGGLAVGLLLTRGSDKVNRLYAVDLVGAGLGCAAIAVVMPALGGSGSVLLAAAIGLIAAAVFGFAQARATSVIALLLGIFTFVGSFAADRLIPITVTRNKASRQGQQPVYSAWNTISKIDVYEAAPQRPPGNERGYRIIIIDAGTAATSIEGITIPGRWSCLVYFASLGFGFILIEIAMLQRFTLFLGQPVYTLAAILASLLVFTGIGSALGERLTRHPRQALLRTIPLLLLMLFLTALVSPIVFRFALAFTLPSRIAIAVAMVAPLGVVLGVPFPLGLRLAAQNSQALVPWAWGINGFFTVLGSICALILGMAFGFRMVLAIAGACYILAYVSISIAGSAPSAGLLGSPISEA
jgi:hypothetical protein